jgi:methionine--tRNA ligase beta chain
LIERDLFLSGLGTGFGRRIKESVSWRVMTIVPPNLCPEWVALCRAATARNRFESVSELVTACRQALPTHSELLGGGSLQSERTKFIERMLERLQRESLETFAGKVLPDVLARGEKTFLCGPVVTALDVAAARATAPVFETWVKDGLDAAQRSNLVQVWRWFDLMQNLLHRYGHADRVELVPLPPKAWFRSTTAQAPMFGVAGLSSTAARSGTESQSGQQEDQETRAGVEAAPAPGSAVASSKTAKTTRVETPKDASGDGRSDLARVDIRVGEILTAKPHPDADALYVEEIDIGRDSGPVTVCSGLRKYIPDAAELLGPCIVVANLKPVKMRGIVSEAMVLCATSADGTQVELVKPPPGAKPGDRVYFPGTDADRDNQPDAQLNPKKKIFEKVAEHFRTSTDPSCEARYGDIPFTTDKGPCRAATIQGGTIR